MRPAGTRGGAREAGEDGRAAVLVATRSPHKLEEIRTILPSAPVRFVSLSEAGIERRPEERDLEPHETFAENALSKARHFHGRSGLPTLADDSGLCVDALGGGPGVRTKRFAPEERAKRLGRDAANNRHLLELLEGVEEEARGAEYRCAMAAVDARGERVVEGKVRGRIARAPRGSGGFGYDPLFLLPDRGRTYAELPAAVKRETSHRARALRALVPWLEEVAERSPPRETGGGGP